MASTTEEITEVQEVCTEVPNVIEVDTEVKEEVVVKKKRTRKKKTEDTK